MILIRVWHFCCNNVIYSLKSPLQHWPPTTRSTVNPRPLTYLEMCLNFLHRVRSWYNISLTRQKIFVYFWGGRTKIHLVLGSRFPAACNEEAQVDLLYWIPPYCLANGVSWPKSGTKPTQLIMIMFNYSTLQSPLLPNISKSHCTALICPGSCRIIVITSTNNTNTSIASITNTSQRGPERAGG